MKNSNYIINGILGVAVIVLFILQFTVNRSGKKSLDFNESISDSIGLRLPLAYIRTDSLLSNYKFFIDLNEAMQKKYQDKQALLKRREERFQKDYTDFVQRMQSNNFITQEKAEMEQRRLVGIQNDLEKDFRQFEYDLQVERATLQQDLSDNIISALKIFNTPKKYEIIFSAAGTDVILYADDAYDITVDVTEFLNNRYVPEK